MNQESTDTKANAEDEQALTLQKMMFDQMKRLSDPESDLDKEIKRSQALSSAGTIIINAAKVRIDAVRVNNQVGRKNAPGSQKEIGDGK
jgi:hypothetical protein